MRFRNNAFYMFILIIGTLADANLLSADDVERSLIGYSSELSLRPGDTVDFMVSAMEGGSYEADLVRDINGDNKSIYADQFLVDPIKASFQGRYEGKEQPLNTGSYVHIEDASALDGL